MFRFILIIILAFLSFNNAKARVNGVKINWEQVGEDTFRVNLHILRNCNDLALPSILPFTVQTNCGIQRLNITRSDRFDVTPVCSKVCSRCKKSNCTFSYGTEMNVYSLILVTTNYIKNGCCEIDLIWQVGSGARTNEITTGAKGEGVYVKALLNACTGKSTDLNWTENHRAITFQDHDYISNFNLSTSNVKDSIVYSFTRPMSSASGYTSWNTPYSYNKPLSYLGFPKTNLKFPRGFHLDSQTAEIMFRPTKVEFTLMAIKGEVYRNGTKIAESTNEFTFIVMKSPGGSPPVLSGINCKQPKTQNFRIQACADQEISFSICSSDKDKDDTVSLRLVDSINGASFRLTNKGSKRESGIFNWTPDSTHIRSEPYRFVVEAFDNACPINEHTRVVYSVTVKESPQFSLKSKYLGCGKVEYVAVSRSKVNVSQWFWKVINGPEYVRRGGLKDTLIVEYDTPGPKVMNLACVGGNGCNYLKHDTIVVPNDFVLATTSSDTTVCENSTISLKASIFNEKGPISGSWNTSQKFNTDTSSILIKAATKNNFYVVEYSDGKCFKDDTINVYVNQTNKTEVDSVYAHCLGDTTQIRLKIAKADSFDIDTILNYHWYDSNKSLVGTDSIMNIKLPGSYYLSTTDSLGCVHYDSFQIKEHEPVAKPLFEQNIYCNQQLDSIKYSINSNHEIFGWRVWPKWNGRNYGMKEVKGFNDSILVYRFQDDSLFSVHSRSKITGCTDSIFLPINYYRTKPTPSFLNFGKFCYYDTLVLEADVDSGFWTCINSGKIYTDNPLTYIPAKEWSDIENYTFEYTPIERSGCEPNIGVFKFSMGKTPITEISMPDTVLQGSRFTIEQSITPSWKYDYEWRVGNPVFATFTDYWPTMIIDSLGTVEIKLRVKNQNTGCLNAPNQTDSVTVVLPQTKKESIIKGVKVYPNPFCQELNFTNTIGQNLQYQMIAQDGKVVFEQNSNQATTNINLSHLAKGVYTLKITGNGFVEVQQVVKE